MQPKLRKLRHLTTRVAPGMVALARYQRSWLPKDLAAGLSVAAIALLVGIVYADLAGVPAVVGIYSAIFPLFVYALFGSSRQLMTGPDAATCFRVEYRVLQCRLVQDAGKGGYCRPRDPRAVDTGSKAE